MTLTQDQRELLERLRKENDAAGHPFTPGPHWQKVHSQFEEWFDEYDIADVINQPFNDHYAGLPNFSSVQAAWYDWMTKQYGAHEFKTIYALYAALLEHNGCTFAHKLSWYFLQNPKGMPWDLMTACEAVCFIEAGGLNITEGERTVLDLGGGWGRIGCSLRLINNQVAYIDCDLPESLLIASTYLPQVLSEAPSAPVGEFQFDPGIYFIPAYKIESIPDGSLDIIINMASMQEMTPPQIESYYKIIQQKASYFYSMQIWPLDAFTKIADWMEWELLLCKKTLWGEKYSQALFKVR